jgi:c-di-GMP-binding flagellar brake protein YcgR
MNVFSTLSLYPLQMQVSDFWKSKSSSSNDAIFFIVGIVLIVIVLVVVNLLKNKGGGPAAVGGKAAPGAGTPRRFSGFTLHRIANNAGLDREQAKMLEYVLKSDGVVDPERSVNTPSLLDRHFKRTYRAIERSAATDEEAQERLSLLFATRNILEANTGGGAVSSTRQVPDNAAAVLNVGNDSYPVRVTSTKGESLMVENPKNALGSAVRLARGTKVSISFFTKSSRGFSFESRVVGAGDSRDGPVLQIAHSSQIKHLAQRRFRRRQGVIATDFYFVYLEEGSRKKEKKLVVDKRRLTGNIMDISIGGCSIKTNAPVTSGTRLKIEFISEEDSTVAALGQVLRTNRSGASTIIHIKFLRVPRRSMNAINAYVYEYVNE